MITTASSLVSAAPGAPRFVMAGSASEALHLSQEPGAIFMAGGTALQLAWGDTPPPVTIIDVSRLPEAQGVTLAHEPGSAGTLRIGAAMKLEALRKHPLVQAHAPLLARALETLAALGVRHLASLGGNVGWRMGDTLPALLVAGAWLETGDPSLGMLALEDALAITAPRGIGAAAPSSNASAALPLVTAVHIPLGQAPCAPVARAFEKVGLRAAFSPSRLALALEATLQEGRIGRLAAAAGGAGLPARRLRNAEGLLQNLPIGDLPSVKTALRAACQRDLDDDAGRARLAANLLSGHLQAAWP